MPEIAGMKTFYIQDSVNDSGNTRDFGYNLYGADSDTLNRAGLAFIEMLRAEKGLFDLSSSVDPSSKEIQLQLKPVAYDLGLNLRSVANQMGQSFFGSEALESTFFL